MLDYLGAPAPDVVVSTTDGSVEYLSADRRDLGAELTSARDRAVDLARTLGLRQHDLTITESTSLTELARLALPHQVHKALWDTLDVSYFMRHDACDIAWHTRQLSRHVHAKTPIVRARPFAEKGNFPVT